ISWLNWKLLEENRDLFGFVSRLVRFRAEHPVLRRSDYFRDRNSSDYPELSFHGTLPWQIDENQPFLCFGFMYAEPKVDYGTEGDTFIYCAVNAFWEEKRFELPIIPEGFAWRMVEYTGREGEADCIIRDRAVTLMPRSLMLLTATAGT
ncbi:MAG: glycogen debranching enzyme, partial [Clostridium sp.]|nr:glycogen debranching enzyme [Clostridium sp.]